MLFVDYITLLALELYQRVIPSPAQYRSIVLSNSQKPVSV